MKKVLTRRNAIAAGIVSVVIIAAVVATTVMSNALTLDEAKAIAKKEVPSTAEFKDSEDEDNKYEVVFYDPQNKETFEVEVNKETQKVKKVERQLDNDLGSSTIKLSEADIESIVRDRFSGITSISVELSRDDDLYEYEVNFKSADFYGEATVNPETGAILESTLKYGTATVVPGGSKGLMTYDEAEKAVLAEAGGGTVKDIDLEDENDTYYYDVEIVKGDKEYEYTVDATNGKVTLEGSHAAHFDSDNDNDSNDDADDNDSNSNDNDSITGATPAGESSDTAVISTAKAKSIVLAKIPGASIKTIGLHKDDGKSVYEGKAVLGNSEYEFEINASSGVITDWEKETIDQDDNESDDDNDSDDHEDDENDD